MKPYIAGLLTGLLLAVLVASEAAFTTPGGSGGTPTVGTCGTNPSVSGTDMVGQITIGTGTVTACTLTFSTALPIAPKCQATGSSGAINVGLTSTSTTTMVLGFSASLPGGKINYFCPVM